MQRRDEASSIGARLRSWRVRCGCSQLELALRTGVSARHLSFVETGRSRPSLEVVLHLAEELDVPLRERNALLRAGGYRPFYAERELSSAPMRPIREAIEALLAAHEPHPALAIDRCWNRVAANAGSALLVEGVAPWLLEEPVNALRIALHPEGLAPRIMNFSQWRAHLLGRLRRHAALSGDPALEGAAGRGPLLSDLGVAREPRA